MSMKAFLLKDDLINDKNKDKSRYPNGSFDELMTYIKGLQVG